MKKILCLLGLTTFLVLSCSTLYAQEKVISGVVTSLTEKTPVVNATVTLEGTTRSVVTDANGKFTIAAGIGQSLIITSVGYDEQRFTVGDENSIMIVLAEAKNMMEEIVVGYGTQRKVNLTGAVSVVDVTKTFGSKPLNDPMRALQGVVPGLTIQYGNGGLTSGGSINIRGLGSINGSSRPLILVDNVETIDLSFINPNDIESISVLKDAASTSIYGSRAAFGVLLIKTKSGRKNQTMTVNYNNYFSWNKPTILPEFADPVDELQALNDAGIRAGTSSPETFGMNLVKLRNGIINWKQNYAGKNGNAMVQGEDWAIDPVDGRAYFFKVWDPKEEMLNDFTFSQQHNLSVQGGGEKFSYYLSGGLSRDGGIFKMNPDKVDKYNVTVGLNASPTKWLDLSVRTLNRNFSYDYPFSYWDYWYYFWRWGAYFPYGTHNGNYFRTNSAYMNGASKSNATSNYQRMDFGATVKINKDLSFRADYTISRDNVLR